MRETLWRRRIMCYEENGMTGEHFTLNHIPAVLYGEPSSQVWLYLHG